MQPGISIEEIKKYNASLREYKGKAATLTAQIEVNRNELERQCKELSAEIGIEVTPSNVKQILEERIAKINNTMMVGNEILGRIRAQESLQQTGTTAEVSMDATPTSATQDAPIFGNIPSAPNIPNMGVTTSPDKISVDSIMSEGLPPIFGAR